MEFHKDVLHNINEFQRYEWLESNALGAYSGSSITGMNLRREHGLLVVPHSLLDRKVVTLAKFEETIFIENRLFEISTNRYKDSIYPHGYQYQEKFSLNPFPTFVYKIEDRRIRKVLFLLEHQNILLVRYELMNQGRPVTLVIKPFIAVRFNNSLNREIQGLNTDTYLGNSFVRWAPRPEMPELYIYFDKGEFITASLWYHSFIYAKDFQKYGQSKEDLFNPGFFQVELKPYEKFDLFVATDSLDDFKLDFEEQFYRETKRRDLNLFNYSTRNPLVTPIGKSLQRSILFREDKFEFPVSQMNNQKNLLHFLLELAAILYTTKNYAHFKNTILNILNYLDSGLLPTNYPVKDEKPVYNQADLGLWLIYVIYLYYKVTGDLQFIEGQLFEKLRSIVDCYLKGTTFNIYVGKDGLVFAGDRSINVSWFPLKKENKEVYRYGKLLEVNALWFNALKTLELFSSKLKKRRLTAKYRQLAEKVRESFNKKFVSKSKIIFYDFINHDSANEDFRLNQIIPLCLPFSVCDDTFAKKVLSRIEEELLTPYGLRSQSIYDSGYRKNEYSDTTELLDFYNGAVWPWTIIFYVQALLKYSGDADKIDKIWKNYFTPLFDLVNEGILGYIPEGLHFNERLNPVGIEDFNPALATIIWADFLVSKNVNKAKK